MTFTIKNSDLDMRTAEEALQAFNVLPPQWKNLLPVITVTLTHEQFNHVPALHAVTSEAHPHWKEENWREVHALDVILDVDHAEVWLRVDPSYTQCQNELYRLLGKVAFFTTPGLCRRVKALVGDGCKKDGAALAIFTDAFARFFLDRATLQNRQPSLWLLMQSLDRTLLSGELRRL